MADLQLGKINYMIYDKIKNIDRYKFLDQIKKFDISNYEKGKFDINGDDFFGIGLEYDTKNESECLWEAHEKYLDIHYILEGEEVINISDIAIMKSTMDFDYENDYCLFEGKKTHSVVLKKGDLLILFPNEVHQTAVKVDEVTSVKKIVFKIKL